MNLFIPICLLNIIALAILTVVSVLTYYFFFIKYKDRLAKSKENDVNKGSIKLKYCLNCGEELNKKRFCCKCKSQF